MTRRFVEVAAATPVLLTLATLAAVLVLVHVAAWLGLALLVGLWLALIAAVVG